MSWSDQGGGGAVVSHEVVSQRGCTSHAIIRVLVLRMGIFNMAAMFHTEEQVVANGVRYGS